MVVVSPQLVRALVADRPLLSRAYELLVEDEEVHVLWEMSNVMAVKRMRYNDHGPVHAQIAAGAALQLFDLLMARGIRPTSVVDGTARSAEEAALVPLLGGLLHDIGNSIHRDGHERNGALLAIPILDRILRRLIDDPATRIRLRQEVLHSIYCTAYDVSCLTVEAGCVKVGDGLDMAEGRARVPYRLGGTSIHSLSALSIRKVDVSPGDGVPIKITVYMDESAGVFQVDEVLLPKLHRTPLRNYIEIYVMLNNELMKRYP
ncbi:MAG: phosphohydrolase [Desulfurococcaceae archaeon]